MGHDAAAEQVWRYGRRGLHIAFFQTMLSMLAKRGSSFEDRLVLGYHTQGLKMALTYSRDAASRPLQILCGVLNEIRKVMNLRLPRSVCLSTASP